MENGFKGDPSVFFFFRVTTGGGVRRDGFYGDMERFQKEIHTTSDEVWITTG